MATLDDLQLLSERLATDSDALTASVARVRSAVEALLAIVHAITPGLNDADQAKLDAAVAALSVAADKIEATVADTDALASSATT